MASRLEKLMFSVALIDKASGPASKLQANMDKLTGRTTAGMAKIGVGAAGLFSTAYALKSMLAPAIEMDRAIGEVRSLGVADSALKLLEKTALRTSMQYGLSATDIVRSSYDIQSAIGGLTDNELSKFTEASAILAKGTKSDASTITDYMGTMFGIFKNSANEMGKAEWVQMLTGQTATAVQMFKTTGSEMAGAFANLGAEAQSAGVGMNEQMAIMGTLQATMSGSEAGTKYKAFLAGVGKAQDELGLTFTDSQGRMLPMLDVLEKLRGKFGDTFDVAESDALQKAFGSKNATGLIKLLMQDTGGLAKSIDDLGKVKGMKAAEQMAQSMVDPWERLSAVGTAVKTVFGRVMQPVLVPLIDKLMAGGQVIIRWTELFPNLTKVVGTGMLVVFGLVAAVSAFSLVSGIASMAMGGLQAIMLVGTAAMWLFNAAMWANPMTWIVAGVVAFVAAIFLAIKYWDKIKASIMDSGPFKMLGKALDWVIDKLNMIPGINIGGGKQSSVPGAGAAPGESDLVSVGARDSGLNVANKVPVGGLQQSIANNNGTTIEKLEVNTTGGVNGFQLADELALAGG